MACISTGEPRKLNEPDLLALRSVVFGEAVRLPTADDAFLFTMMAFGSVVGGRCGDVGRKFSRSEGRYLADAKDRQLGQTPASQDASSSRSTHDAGRMQESQRCLVTRIGRRVSTAQYGRPRSHRNSAAH